MDKFYGNYLGLCISNTDPEFRGRVQIFIPHIMPALYERWNQAGVDRKIEIVGNNLEQALPQKDIDQLKKMLPWAEAASPVFGNSVAGHYNPQSGNFNQSYNTENQAAVGVNPVAVGGGSISLNSDGSVSKGEFLGFLESQIANSGLNGFVPTDGAKYGIDGTPQSWANYLYHLAGKESSFNTNTVGDIGKFTGNSNGLFQLSPLDYNNYKGAMQAAGIQPGTTINGQPAFSQQQLIDPVVNTTAAIVITQQLVRQDGAIGNSANTGAARYWGPLRRGWTPPASSIDITDPSAGGYPGSSNPAQPSPFLSPEPPPYIQLEPSQQAILNNVAQTTSQSTLPGTGPSSGGGGKPFNWSNSVASSQYNIGSDGILRTSSGVTACLNGTINSAAYITGNTAWQGSTGISFAKDVGGVNNKLTSLATSGPGKGKVLYGNLGIIQGTGYQPQQGDIAIHQAGAGKYGHAQIFVDGNWHSYKTEGLNFDAYAGKSGQQTTVFRLTPDGQAAVQQTGLCNTDYMGIPYAGPIGPVTSVADVNGLEGQAGMVRNPTPTQPSVTDTTGMPQGMFSVPNPGAMLWVFFREGDPLFPVYFAASYGSREWQNAFKSSSPGAHYPQEGDTTPRNQAIFRPNQSGGISFVDTITDEEDARSLRLFHANGGHMEWHSKGSVLYSPNEHVQQVAGNAYNSCLNREDWTQGDSNQVTIGDRITIVGNMSQEALAIIEEHAQIVKDINKNMLKEGGSSSASTTTTKPTITTGLTNSLKNLTNKINSFSNEQRNETQQKANKSNR
jgi:hypothetical protein